MKLLLTLFQVSTFEKYLQIHKTWVDTQLATMNASKREVLWSQNLANGNKNFVEGVLLVFSTTARHRDNVEENDTYTL